MHIALEEGARDSVRDAARLIVPAENFEIHTEITENHEGDSLLALRVFAETHEEAVSEAEDVYRRIREKAALPPAAALVLGYISPWWSQHRTADLGKEALELNKQGRHALAVIRVQTVCEIAITETLTRLLKDQHPEADPARLIRRPATLRDEYSKAFLEMLTSHRVQDQTWWPSYIEHLKRRNAIVHEGLVISRDDAIASIEVSHELRTWLLSLRERSEQPS